MNIYVGNVKYEMTGDQLKEMFSAYGEVSSARIISDRETGRSKGFGFVEMPNDSEAKAAIEATNENNLFAALEDATVRELYISFFDFICF